MPDLRPRPSENLPDLITKYVRTGKVKLQARTLSFIGPDSVRAAKVAAGAAQQGKQWAFLETFFASQGTENSGYVTDDFLTSVANAAGVDADRALAFADGSSAQEALDQADAQAAALGVGSTPSFTREDRQREREGRRGRARRSQRQARCGAREVTRAASFAVAFAGLAIAIYLTVVHYAGGEPVCAIAHGCATVQKSDYAVFAGIPVAVLGIVGVRRRSSLRCCSMTRWPVPRPRSCRSWASASARG